MSSFRTFSTTNVPNALSNEISGRGSGCNLPDQTVVGGTEEDLHLFVEYVKLKFGRRATYLNTAGAFHTYLMVDAARKFRSILDSTELTPPHVKVLSNYTGTYHSFDSAAIKASLFFQLFHPVRWIWGMLEALSDGINLIIEFGGGVGNDLGPEQRRPNLQSITKRAVKKSGHHALYTPAINSGTIRDAAGLVRSLDMLVSEPHDEPRNAVDENWFHLLLPVRNRIVTQESIEFLRLVDDLGLSHVVQLVATPAEEDGGLMRHGPPVSRLQPCLELIVGCESAACLAYWGDEIPTEIHNLRRRLEHPGYGDKALPQRASVD